MKHVDIPLPVFELMYDFYCIDRNDKYCIRVLKSDEKEKIVQNEEYLRDYLDQEMDRLITMGWCRREDHM